MLTYLLIAIGGAIGSVGRAWLGNVVVSLAGVSFPWGTLLINVVGSFVIGFFGTLTAADGRFTVASDWRAFVMIGLCGGFTTFSSFSLQSFDLLRDGRPAQALANIALSVLLCLGVVAAGYATAQAIRGGVPGARLAAAGAAPGDRIADRILVVLHGPETASRQLDAAALLLHGAPDGRITALAIKAGPDASWLPTEEVLTRERRQAIRQTRNLWLPPLRQSFADWQRGQSATCIKARLVEVAGRDRAVLREHGNWAQLLLMERLDDPLDARRVHDALLLSRRPILLMPPAGGLPFGRTIAIAWQDDEPARHAVTSAAPLLSQARQLVLIRVGQPAADEPVPLPAALAQRANAVAIREIDVPPSDAEPIGVQLLRLADEAGADLLVMGGTARGSMAEMLLGGATGTILDTARIPVLMQH